VHFRHGYYLLQLIDNFLIKIVYQLEAFMYYFHQNLATSE